MEDLMEKAEKVMAGFNPATDEVVNYDNPPDGVYECLVEKVTSGVTQQKGCPFIKFHYSILDENVSGFLFVSYYFTDKTTDRSIKMLTKLAYEWGYTIPMEAFQNLETLAEALNNLAGNQATVEQKTKEGSTYPNYKVTPVV